ncbi:MAG: hypothetical protein IK152_06610 [Lachnospiraceae bacterium]|nr:hypothetical protein [Lachnospiraceae bacterium]
MQGQGIVYCNDNPIRTDGIEWLNSHIGRIAVGKRISPNTIDILAYSDNLTDSKALRKYAKINDALYIRSVDNRGVTSVD